MGESKKLDALTQHKPTKPIKSKVVKNREISIIHFISAQLNP